ncbi:anti-sigma factor [Dyella ginsengisoli]|jgi:anti-sigma-K factor RskA|uniref:Anti-sigma factor n=1 Tax=Dyella ginsengisoli TaxID=363848 RepID=A0ABW8JU82_9GAMM
MNNPMPPSQEELRYAEYVLGVLDADARAAVEQEVRTDRAAAAAVSLWQRHLMPLSEDIAPVQPAEYVWVRIREAVGLDASVSPRSPAATGSQRTGGWWNSLQLWRWIGAGATLAAAASFTLWFTTPHAPQAPASATAGPDYMVASIAQDNGVAGWTATMDLKQSSMVIVPATPAALGADRSAELWLVPPGEKPISLGVIAPNKPTTVHLRPDLLARLSAKALLAVSNEPLGGSPTGQATGPIIAKGAISGA